MPRERLVTKLLALSEDGASFTDTPVFVFFTSGMAEEANPKLFFILDISIIQRVHIGLHIKFQLSFSIRGPLFVCKGTKSFPNSDYLMEEKMQTSTLFSDT